jgi:molybdopterin synthase sulfur carrier subunit
MRLVYFAAVREAIGVTSETCDLPTHVRNINDTIDWLAGQSPGHALAFQDKARLRFALDQDMVPLDAALGEAYELAIFPPVTGG